MLSGTANAGGLGVCQKVFALSHSALSNKAKGVSKDKLVSVLPKKQGKIDSEPLRSMREIVEEIYTYKITNHFAYSVYRSELCVLREKGKVPSVKLEQILPKLNSCSDKSAECAMKLVRSKI